MEDDTGSVTSDASSTLSRTSLVERTPWSLMAYTSFIWWASAGEKRSGLTDEEEAEQGQDSGVLMADRDTTEAMIPGHPEQETPQPIALVAYFHRLTSLIFTTISDAISRQDGEDVRRNEYEEDEMSENPQTLVSGGVNNTSGDVEPGDDRQPLMGAEGKEDEAVEITQEDMTMMGLDIWSGGDRSFVEELTGLWWGRKVDVKGGQIECCGVRVV